MTRFEYVSIFNGIIVALALENVAASFHKLFEANARVRWHWMAPTNAIGASVATLGWFWLQWIARDLPPVNPTVFTFLPSALSSILLYLICAAALPDEVPAAGVDMKDWYFSSRKQFWSLVGVGAVVTVFVLSWSVVRHNFAPANVRLNTPFIIGELVVAALSASLIWTRAQWWHAVAIVVITAGVFFIFGPIRI
jgi:hypothetical protein